MTRMWTADALMELMRGFQPACVLAAGAELGVFDALADGPASAADVASRTNANPRAVIVLLDALAALDLLVKQGNTYAILPALVDLLTERGERPEVLAMVRHQANCLRRWAQLGRVVHAGEPAERVASVRGPDADQAAFIQAMHAASAGAAAIIADIGPPAFRHLLDVGGASGTWTIAFLRAMPDAKATLFDLPPAIDQARLRLSEAGLRDRVTLVPGDFYADPLPAGADLAWVSAILHQNSRDQNRDLFRKVADALEPGGRILIRDIVMDESRTRPVAGALFAVNMLTGTPRGGTFTLREIEEDLTRAGFADVTLLRRDEWMNSVVQAVKRT
ncbi:MAG: methyltransferase domain-containing protein [Phycisphaerae bacterium]|nr:methyltransferase domain-containing protein [Phycisphaerae bacterium]